MNRNTLLTKKRRIPKLNNGLPFWAYSAIAFIYSELLLLITIGVNYSNMSWLYMILTGAATGAFFGTVISLLSRKYRRWSCIVMLAVNAVLFCVQYFVYKSFLTCMNLASVLSGAGDVTTGFTETAILSVLKGFWVIILFFIPLILFCLFDSWLNMRRLNGRMPLVLVAASLATQMLCIGIISINPIDRARMFEQYNFDSAVHTFGLNNATYLDIIDSLGGNKTDDFEHIPDDSESSDTSVDTDISTDTEDIPPAVIEYGDNISNIDFSALAETSSSSDLAKLHSYVASVQPTKKNQYTGMFEGKNLILITAEAFSAEVIDAERTPTLYRLANKGIKFTDYYQPAWGGSTSTGEYSILMGLVPMSGVKSIKNTVGKNLYMTMGNQLQREGYFSLAFHNGQHTYYSRNQTHKNFGYSDFIAMGNGMEQGVSSRWPASDLEMMQHTFPMYADQEHFSVYYMTVSGHCLYNWTGNSMSKRNKDLMANVDASETIKAYYAANQELEKALAYLVEELEKKGIADDTVIAISTDHYPYGLEKSETWGTDKDYLAELYGYESKDCFERDHSALIIWSGCLEDLEEPIVVDTPTYSLDILPTLSNLFGLEYDSRLLVGRDVLDDKSQPLVVWTNYSWLTDKGSYDARTGKFTPKDGIEISDDYIKKIKSIVGNKINFSKSVITYDYYDVLFGN